MPVRLLLASCWICACWQPPHALSFFVFSFDKTSLHSTPRPILFHSLRLATNCHPQALKAALASERDAAAANQAAVAEGRRRVASLKEEQEKLKVRVACVAGCLRGCACIRLLV